MRFILNILIKIWEKLNVQLNLFYRVLSIKISRCSADAYGKKQPALCFFKVQAAFDSKGGRVNRGIRQLPLTFSTGDAFSSLSSTVIMLVTRRAFSLSVI